MQNHPLFGYSTGQDISRKTKILLILASILVGAVIVYIILTFVALSGIQH
jgi:FtsH-binding integral membrane protein